MICVKEIKGLRVDEHGVVFETEEAMEEFKSLPESEQQKYFDLSKIEAETGIPADTLPCPFCGTSIEHLQLYGADRNYIDYLSSGASAYIECLSCGARGPEIFLSQRRGDNFLKAVFAAWNRRYECTKI